MYSPARPYEPLTSENAALVLVDHQVGLMTGVRDYSIAELKHNVVGLAKAGKALKLPIVVTTTARDSMWGPTFPELVEALPGADIIDRASVNAFDDPRVARAIEATERNTVELLGEIANIVELSTGPESRKIGPYRSSVKLVAGVGFEKISVPAARLRRLPGPY